ncbi:MAG: hypothetical protein CO093_06460 [Alphaproteobacteria bacterium CG_4_9_14_3_um_filter_47_13]|nr:MAG: hypothetical protein CO093_06460 [Alphaproteobacteria bacterium CG_4_9_14_3_um_filter_47_13]
MKIAQFKKMLLVHGADLSRWEDPAAARTLIESSVQVRILYQEAQKFDGVLDDFKTDMPDLDLMLDDVMARITTQPQTMYRLESQKKRTGISKPVFWGGISAVAAMVLLLMTVEPSSFSISPSQTTTLAMKMNNDTGDDNIVLAELDRLAEEEVAYREVISLWEMAEAKTQDSEQEIEKFLDEILSITPEEDHVTPDEMEIWRLFLERQDIREL